MSISENTLSPHFAGILEGTGSIEDIIDRRTEGNTLSLERAQAIVDEFEALTQDKDAIRTLRRLVHRSVERVSAGKLSVLQARLEIGIRENTPESIRTLISEAYEKLSENEHRTHVPEVLKAKSKTVLRLGETLRDLGHKTEPITNQLQCKPGKLYKIYPPNKTIRRSITGMCRGHTAGGAPYFEFENNSLLQNFELEERRLIQRIKTDTDRVVTDEIILFGGHFAGYTHLGRPVFRILEPVGETSMQEKLVVVDGDRYKFSD